MTREFSSLPFLQTLFAPVRAPEDQGGPGDQGQGGEQSGAADAASQSSQGDGAGGEGSAATKPPLQGDGLAAAVAAQQNAEGKGEGDGDTSKGDQGGRPEWVAEKFWDSEKGEVRIEALAKSQADAEKQLGQLKREKGGEPPESVDAYFAEPIEIPPEADRIPQLDVDDPLTKVFANIAFEEGLNVEAARRMVGKFLMGANEHMPEAFDPQAELEKLGKNGAAEVNGVLDWSNSLLTNGAISEDENAFLVNTLGKSATGIRLMTKIREMTGEKPIPVGDPISGQALSEQEWYAERAKAREAGDEAKMAELDARAPFGAHAAGSSPILGR